MRERQENNTFFSQRGSVYVIHHRHLIITMLSVSFAAVHKHVSLYIGFLCLESLGTETDSKLRVDVFKVQVKYINLARYDDILLNKYNLRT